MATPTPQILRVLWEEVEVSYTDVALDVLSLYEFVITIGDEARVVWKRPWTMSSILFLSNRWIGMVGMNIVGVTPLTPEMIAVTGPLVRTLIVLSAFLVALFSALRVYAITNRNILLSAIVFILGSTLGDALIFQYVHEKFVCQDGDCGFVDDKLWNTQTIMIWNYLVRSNLVAADAIVLILTWKRTLREYWTSRRLHVNSPIVTSLFRDGTWYFVALLAANIMLFFDQLDSSFTQTVSEVATALPPILINRFIINLQAASSTERTQLTDASTTQNESEAEFRRPSTTNFLGNIGEPLTDGSVCVDERDDAAAYIDASIDDASPEVLKGLDDSVERIFTPQLTAITYIPRVNDFDDSSTISAGSV